ncbi:carbohydrate ABC transporter permease [Paenibacillus durus]|uniref:ABC transporter permease n=1 Tax=Paenibacillus durus ATCC 35681 TaxID=1333534 RepID=A0A0F7CKF9_PAEDU|nr:sugar ABC transporter permease [Paenibacillus durus]AKG37591.1 ABC transporter permease [Paenibacillus durus ATCC 35681]
MLFYAGLVLYPIAMSLWYSLLDWNGIGTGEFIGLKNYQEALMNDPIFWNSLKNTLIYVVTAMGQVAFALFIAILMSLFVKRSNFLVSSYFMPVILSVVVIGQLWKSIYNPASSGGMLSSLLLSMGLDSWVKDWLADSATATYALAFVLVWQYFGYHLLIQFTGLQNVPEDLYEAAKIDGASGFQTVRNITLPLMMPVIKISVVLATIGSLKSFELVMAMTGGGPANLTEVLSSHFYNVSFQTFRSGYGSAISTILIILCFALTFLVNLSFRRSEKALS